MEIKNFVKKNLPLPIFLHYINRMRLKNNNFTLLTPNCLGGIIYHNLGLPFLSPTINIQFNSKLEFFKFCKQLNYYITLQLEECFDNSFPYPIAKLGDLTLHLVHYKTFQEAFDKWEIRKKRMNLNNIYIITDDHCSDDLRLSNEDIRAFTELTYTKNLIIFTQEKTDIPYTRYIGKEKLKNFMRTNKYTGIREFELSFDYVHFLNNVK